MGNALNAREAASLVWLVAVFGFAFMKPSVRDSIRGVFRAFWTPKVATPVAAYFAYVAALVVGAARLGVWDGAMLKDTLVWALGPAVVLLFNADRAGREKRFFVRSALGVVEVTAVLVFWTNLFVLPFAAELVLVPFLTSLAMLAAYAATKPEHEAVAHVTNAVLGVTGASLFGYAVYRTVVGWDAPEWPALTRTLVLPAWLTVGVLPFLAVFALVMVYGTTFAKVNVLTKNGESRRRVKAALLVALHVRVRTVGAIRHEHLWNAIEAESFRGAWLAVRRAGEPRGGPITDR